jgi:hypothetical protein
MQAVRQRRTREDDSRGMRASKRAIAVPNGLHVGLVLAGVLGVAALAVATFTTVIAITVGTTSRLARLDTSLSGWDRHGPALLVIAALALVMLAGAARGARPAMAAVLVCGVFAVVVALGLDLPHLDDTGLVGELYSDASAGPGVGFWLEVGGAALLCVAGGGLLLAERRSSVAVPPRSRTAHRGEGATSPAAPLRDADV